ncbi:mandelate racemase [Candidatus Marsarchaeota G2 archaeon ECH_B_2]|uniref:gluconate dehydratase n=4 Tax=Candidatus Marsarchaeota group 2 TaxID=2203771 RepID=A0A2R6BBU3_9ARCH|nr:MAG: mandelate racemase [Candidatus Marsarchaeota G2 archaeon ECH_B_2]PSO02724.1 MAG: mandelate racemase [Candidatus Marsarchaeota G2 archaeon ECH_B_1]
MEIRDFEVYQLGSGVAKGQTWASSAIILKVTTSDGVVGYGEAVPTLRVQPVIASLREVGRVYRGKDPFNFERNRWEWYKHDFYLSESFESTTALSAFDTACWDVVGKVLGVPIHALIGGSFRDRVRVYANGWYQDCVMPEEWYTRTKEVVSKGYSALKFDPFGAYFDWIDREGIRLAVERVKAVRDAAGGGVDLLIEHHGRFNPNSAIAVARALEEFDPLFAEEPVHPENVEGLAKYRQATRLRIALGERVLTKQHFVTLAQRGLVDFFQADVANVGGPTEAKKMAVLAEAYGVEMAYHNAFGPIQNAVTIQLDASIPNFLIQESFYDFFPQWKRDLVYNSTPVVGGHYQVSKKPGLGVDVNEKLLEELRVEGQEYFNPDEPVWVIGGTWKNAR